MSNVDHSKFNDIFGDEPQTGDDVSLKSAQAASQKPATKTAKVKVYDTELGWVEEFVTVPASTSVKSGSLAEAITQYGETFPENVVVTFKSWNGKELRITGVSKVSSDSCLAILDGKETTLNPKSPVTVTIL